ncbi:fumarate reductase/succinate dehydrogenase flavoprotein subunit [Desulforamulus aeronauticus]|uniref:Succinate dehydrogenase/fumarate reductase, flavoprotein subunit n=1 Tax=Desulforamulus aeronauticus DSM 10349 TaxID=1121421 RepID=A0A1M6TA64_9FIRM|nr:fumarate reductase/succinate dehydrogenase flavoprotein subunit [Desulforamulus aeronauticus]SHK53784.1 Succinate dehydrogenase/fumarate reductase, flavoprotein subunit [Desulforamulus aeronauticus DSM 10349]
MAYRKIDADVIIVGGGSAGTFAAIKAKTANPKARVVVLDKGPIETSGAIGRGMDALNIVSVPGYGTPEDVVEALTKVSEGIIDQEAAYVLGEKSIEVIKDLEEFTGREPGDLFPVDENGNYKCNYLHPTQKPLYLAMDGEDIKRALAREVRRLGCTVLDRTATVKLFTADGKVTGVFAFDIRTGEHFLISAPAVVLTAGCAGRFGMPRDGYLSGIYEFPGNTGDGYALAYHAGAEMVNMECFQTNLLMKDFNGPACGYVVIPRGGYGINALGEKYWSHGYWSGDMFLAVWREFTEGRGPVYLKLDHLPEDTIQGLEKILWGTERTVRGQFHKQRNENYRCWDSVEQGMEEITLCSGHSMSGIWVNKDAETSVPGLFAAGDCAAVPHQYLTGAFVFGGIAGKTAAEYAAKAKAPKLDIDVDKLWKELRVPLDRPDGLPVEQVEIKIRGKVSQYMTPPKSDPLYNKMLWWVDRMRREDVPNIKVCDFHDLIKVTEINSMIDCAEMAVKASLYRTESRWGLSHYRLTHPKVDSKWDGKQVVVKKNLATGEMEVSSKDVPKYKWDYPTRLEYEYPELKLEIGKGYVHPDNDYNDPWITEKVSREGMDIPKRMTVKKED